MIFFLSSLGILSLRSLIPLFTSLSLLSPLLSLSLSPLLSSSSIVKDRGSSIDVSTSFTSTACSVDPVFAFIFVMSREQIPCLEGRHESNDPCDDVSKSGNKILERKQVLEEWFFFSCLFYFPVHLWVKETVVLFQLASHTIFTKSKFVRPFSVTDWGLLCIV